MTALPSTEDLARLAKAGELFPEAQGSVEFDQAIYKQALGMN